MFSAVGMVAFLTAATNRHLMNFLFSLYRHAAFFHIRIQTEAFPILFFSTAEFVDVPRDFTSITAPALTYKGAA